jgi:hypothetical protein
MAVTIAPFATAVTPERLAGCEVPRRIDPSVSLSRRLGIEFAPPAEGVLLR